MTERKPPGVEFESWVDKQLREAADRGAFQNLSGLGKPLPGAGKPYDEQWWIRDKLRREAGSADVFLPVPLKLRKEIHELPRRVAGLRTESAVRELVDALNERILAWLRAPTGPMITLRPVDLAEVLAAWRADHPAERAAEPEPTPAAPRRGWWRRRTAR